MKRKLGILISGRGSNFEAIASSIRTGKLNAEIALVISNKADARGIDIAHEFGLPSIAIPSKGVSREEYDLRIVEELQERGVDLVCLAGFMRLLSPAFIRAFEGRILNIHPSLLPAFPGLDAQAQALSHGVRISGCTVHFVNEDLDAGPIVMQAAVIVEDGDTVETLSERILKAEHRIYSLAIELVLSGNYRVEGRRVIRSASHPVK